MKILILGTGIIGTIYGWALSTAGHEVFHLVRSPQRELLKKGAEMDVLDERKGFKKYNKTNYPIRIIYEVHPENHFDLTIVATNWYQIQSALDYLKKQVHQTFYFILTSNWTGTELFERILDSREYILGYPDGGGTIKNGVYWTNLGPEIHIALPDTDNKQGFEIIKAAFTRAQIKLDVQENMLHWLWVHNAGSMAVSIAFQKHRNVEKYLCDKILLKQSLLASRECLELCEKRGATSGKYPEVAALKWPLWLLIPMFKYNFRHNESMKRYTAHGASLPMEDLIVNFNEIQKTATEYQFPMPNFLALKEFLTLSEIKTRVTIEDFQAV